MATSQNEDLPYQWAHTQKKLEVQGKMDLGARSAIQYRGNGGGGSGEGEGRVVEGAGAEDSRQARQHHAGVVCGDSLYVSLRWREGSLEPPRHRHRGARAR